MDLTPIQMKALCMLVAGYTLDEVVEATEVTKRTIDRWKAQPDFRRLLQEGLIRTYDAAIAELCLGARKAAKELKGIIDDPDMPSKNKITAINVLFTHSGKVKEIAIQERNEKLDLERSNDLAFRQNEIKTINAARIQQMTGTKLPLEEVEELIHVMLQSAGDLMTEEKYQVFINRMQLQLSQSEAQTK